LIYVKGLMFPIGDTDIRECFKEALMHNTVNALSTRDIIKIDEELCNGCGNCITACAEGALALVEGKAKLVSDVYCDGLGACLGNCPTGALKITRRASLDFDKEKAALKVADDMREKKCACPGAAEISLLPKLSRPATVQNLGVKPTGLINWPVQMRLIRPNFESGNSTVLVAAASCTAFASPIFHERFLSRGYPLVTGCPKLDDLDLCIIKLSEILKAHSDIKELQVPIMNLPCCRGLIYAAVKAIERAGRIGQVLPRCYIVGTEGEINEEQPMEPNSSGS
jgi:ferredoxin